MVVAQDTPAMRQYRRFKEQHPDCVLFFRMGDFYEMFYDDARLAHRVLGVTLTQRTEGVPMAGVPYHAVENYLRRMIQAGHRVAVCEQMEDPAQAKGVVRRDVTRVITPGTLTDEHLLEEGRENPLAAVLLDGDRAHVAWAELSTGSFHAATFSAGELTDELVRINPRELLYPQADAADAPAALRPTVAATRCVLGGRPAWQFRQAEAVECLCKQYQVAHLSGFGFSDNDPLLRPAGAIVQYLLETQRSANCQAAHTDPTRSASAPNQKSELRSQKTLPHLQPPRRFDRAQHLVIDATSLRSLEIEQTTRSGSTEGTLLSVFTAGGECRTAMGKRTLRQWLCYPLRDRGAIEERQRVVGALVADSTLLHGLRGALDGVQDVQRIASRVAVNRATPRDLVALGTSSGGAEALAALLRDRPAVRAYHDRMAQVVGALGELAHTIAQACVDTPPNHLREGGLIRDGFDAQLDEYRLLQRDSHTWLAGYQKSLIEETGIASLKVGYNRVFGYYIELTSVHRDKAPAAWSRKQTLKNAERFITPQLKEFEGKVLSAESKAVAREQELFAQLCTAVQEKLDALRAFAEAVAELDVLACFARRAVRFRYVQPTIVDEPVLRIDAGRHPVLDELLGDQFVANDVCLGSGQTAQWPGGPVEEGADSPDGSSHSATGPLGHWASSSSPTLALITGPNMAGKSTYIRQTALIALLAHTGSYVPADRAVVGLCDRVFTRIGASDELHTGQSTFMVEMTETAHICHHATPGSLVILDEIGRGTSTLDGLSLAWAIAEHLAVKRCRTLFATHYHELTALGEAPGGYTNVANLNVTVREWQDQIVFLHRIAPGKTDRSYGIHVAKIAGLPRSVVDRANELLAQLEVNHQAAEQGAAHAKRGRRRAGAAGEGQLSLFTQYLEHPVVEALRGVDLDTLSPVQAFDLLRKLRDEAQA